VVAEAIDDVPLGDDSGDPPVLDHRKRADPFLAEAADSVMNARVGSDGLNRRALVAKHQCNGHGSPFKNDSEPVALIVPLRDAKGKSVPQADPPPTPRQSTVQRFWRLFRLQALLSVVIAAIVVVLVVRSAGEVHASLIIATALGVGLTLLVGMSLMTLIFISNSSGHDEAVGGSHEKDKE